MIARRLSALLLLQVLALAAPAVAQDEPLGQPAGWAIEESESLIAVAEGSELRLEPNDSARVLMILPEAQLPLIEARGLWVKVRYGNRVGWVDLEGGPPPGAAPRDAAPLDAAPPIRYVVTERSEPLDIGDGWQEGTLGPYKLFSRVDEPPLIDLFDRVAKQHARVYAERYGLKVDTELDPREQGSVLLFAGRAAFLEFQRAHDHQVAEAPIGAYFHSPNTVFMYRRSDSRQTLAATLLHELTHLVNWRLLRAGGRVGTPTPIWLEEGMAEDLALSRLDRQNRLTAGPLGPNNLRYGNSLGVRLFELGQQIGIGGTAPSLPHLLTMDKAAFFDSDVQLNYLMSAMWIRYLLNDAESQLAVGFRDYLASVAGGGRSDAEELRSRLDRSWDQLSQGFRGWLVVQQARVGL